MIENSIEIWIDQDILNVVFHKETLSFEDADSAIKRRIEMVKGQSFLFFSDARKIKNVSREARTRMAQKDSTTGVIAAAILINSKTHRIMYNFFMKIYKPDANSKIFTDKDKALEWLYQQKKIQS